MYISRLLLNPQNRNTMLALAQPKLFHGAIESGFGGPRQRTLWRLDQIGNNLYLLVVSPTPADLSGALQQFGWPEKPETLEVHDYETYLTTIAAGQLYQFRLAANPVKHLSSPGQRGKVLAHVTIDQQKKWLLDRANKYGFSLKEDDFTVIRNYWIHFYKPGYPAAVRIKAAEFEGRLTVTDLALFQDLLRNGMSRGKAYGLGLMTVIRVKE